MFFCACVYPAYAVTFFCKCLRDLMQVHADFEHIGQAAALATACLYGGSPYQPQESALRRGLDVVVGTPGRVKDHLERGSLRLHKLQCVSAVLQGGRHYTYCGERV